MRHRESVLRECVSIICVSLTGQEAFETQEIQLRVQDAFKLFHKFDNWVLIPSNETGMTREEAINSVASKICDHLGGILASLGSQGTTSAPIRRINWCSLN